MLHNDPILILGKNSREGSKVQMAHMHSPTHPCTQKKGYSTLLYVYTYYRSRYGDGSGPIFLDKVQCEGHESHLLRCNYREPFGQVSSSCSHTTEVAITCCELPVGERWWWWGGGGRRKITFSLICICQLLCVFVSV